MPKQNSQIKRSTITLAVLGAVLLTLLFWGIRAFNHTIDMPSAAAPSSFDTAATVASTAQTVLPIRTEAAATCPTLPAMDYEDQFVNTRFALLSTQLKTLQLQHDEFLLDNTSIISRIGLLAGRSMRDGYEINFKNPLFVSDEVQPASLDAKALLRTLLSSRDLEALKQAVLSGQLPSDKSFFGQSARVFLIEKVIEANLEEQEQAIEQLLEADATVWFSDLVAAIKSDLSDDLVKRLWQHSTLDGSRVLQKGTVFLSLVNIAIEQQRAELAQYFLEIGSPTAPDPFGFAALDLLAKYQGKLSEQQTVSLFKSLYRVSNRYHVRATPERLRNILPVELSTKPLEAALPPTLNNTQTEQIQQSAHTLYRIALEGLITEQTLSGMSSACLAQQGQKVISGIMLAHRNLLAKQAEQRRKQRSKQTSKAASVKVDEQEQTLQAVQQQFHTPAAIEAALAPQQTLAQKRLVQRYRNKEVEQQANAILQQQAADPSLQQREQLMQEIYALAKQNRWQEAKQRLSSVASLAEEAATILLSIAINSSADQTIIVWLLSEGAQILPNAISNIVVIGDIELAELLLQHGLDLHYVDPLNRNALFTAVTMNNLTMLRWLLRKGVSLQPEQAGFDVLDHALLNYAQRRAELVIVSTLIEAGIAIETSHQEIVAGMLPDQLERYAALINGYPELVMGKP